MSCSKVCVIALSDEPILTCVLSLWFYCMIWDCTRNTSSSPIYVFSIPYPLSFLFTFVVNLNLFAKHDAGLIPFALSLSQMTSECGEWSKPVTKKKLIYYTTLHAMKALCCLIHHLEIGVLHISPSMMEYLSKNASPHSSHWTWMPQLCSRWSWCFYIYHSSCKWLGRNLISSRR